MSIRHSRRIAFGVIVLQIIASACAASRGALPPTVSGAGRPSAGPAVIAPPPARLSAAISGQAQVGLDPTVLAQIDALAREKAARNPIQQRIDSQLLYAYRNSIGAGVVSGLQPAVALAPDGRQRLDVRARIDAALLDRVRGLGIAIVESDPAQRALHVLAGLDQVEAIAALPGVVFVAPEARPQTIDHREHRVPAPLVATGSRTSEGDVTHRADSARSTYGVDGTGVRIGVLSNGVSGLASSQASGDLGPVTVLSGQAGSGAEGTAMLEIIRDLAPGAGLYFATATTSPTSFANNIRALRAAGCDIIVDDVAWTGESPFQDGQASSVMSTTNGGVIAQAVKDVVAAGALYFSSAGNSGNMSAHTSGTWEGDFVDGGAVTFPESGRIHSFGGQPYTSLTASSTSLGVELYWSDPFGGSANDYDLYLLNSAGTSVLGVSNNFQTGTQDAYERIGLTADVGERVVIVRYAGRARFLHLGTNRGRLSVATAGEIHGHAATAGVGSLAVAATPAVSPGPYPGAFSASNGVESFSSDGPRRIFFSADGQALTAGNFSATGGQLLNKPDVTAADGVSVTGAGGFPTTFYGTSAAAPHAAAIAALLKSFRPTWTASQIAAAITGSAIDIGMAGIDRDSGAGIAMGLAALQSAAASLTFIDDPLQVGVTSLKAAHIVELRSYIDTLRARYHLSVFAWTDPSLSAGSTRIRAVHITDLRTALAGVYAAANRTPPSYTTITADTSLIRAVYISELRAAVAAIY